MTDYPLVEDFKSYEVNKLRGDSVKVIMDLLDNLPSCLNNVLVRAKIIKELGIEKLVRRDCPRCGELLVTKEDVSGHSRYEEKPFKYVECGECKYQLEESELQKGVFEIC